jgi:predicted TIM-barrel fold metal-dependent hydrolase
LRDSLAGTSDIMSSISDLYKIKKIGMIDVHVHGFLNDHMNNMLLKYIKIFGIEKAFISIYPFDLGRIDPSHEDVLKGNIKIKELINREKSFRGMVYVNLLNSEDVDMAERFLREGFCGIGEIYRSVKPRPGLIKPYIDLAIEYDVPILIHVAHRLYPRSRPREASVYDLCRIAFKWPKAKIIVSHIAGGGDWENSIEILKRCDVSNIYIDTGGSVGDSGMIERLVREFRRENILFGSDNIFSTSIARIEDADVDEDIKIMIYRENPLKVFKCD